MHLPRRLLHHLQGLLPATSGGTTILAYHLVGAGTASPVDLPAARFRRQMTELAETARVVPLVALLEDPPPDRDGRARVVLTFDDAYDSFRTHAFPVLTELGLPATLFVPVGFVDGTAPPPIAGTEGLRPIGWEALGEMAATGLLTVGSHTISHPDLRRLGAEALDAELAGSRSRLEERLGITVETFCYPKGLVSRPVERRVRRVYRAATAAGGRRVPEPLRNPHRLPRVPVRRDMPEALAPVLAAPVWLEEWVADRVRRWLR